MKPCAICHLSSENAALPFQKPDGCTVKKCTNPLFVPLILLWLFLGFSIATSYFYIFLQHLHLDHTYTYAFPVQTSTFPPSRYGVAAAPVPRRAAAAPRSAGASCGDPSDRLVDPPGFDKGPRCAVAHEEPRQCDLRCKDVELVLVGFVPFHIISGLFFSCLQFVCRVLKEAPPEN